MGVNEVDTDPCNTVVQPRRSVGGQHGFGAVASLPEPLTGPAG